MEVLLLVVAGIVAVPLALIVIYYVVYAVVAAVMYTIVGTVMLHEVLTHPIEALRGPPKLPDRNRCLECGGPKDDVICPMCDGEGSFDMTCGEIECRNCDGWGTRMECTRCHPEARRLQDDESHGYDDNADDEDQ